MSIDDDTESATEPDFTATRLVSKSFELDGMEFSWWAVDDSPAFVTVSSRWFGSRSAVAMSDPETTARQLAESIINQFQSQAERIRAQLKEQKSRRTVE
jgi:hypothetical protein